MHAGDILTNRARLTPAREAIYDYQTNHRYSYKQFNERVNRTANFMKNRLGIKKGDRVTLYAHNCMAYLDILYAVGKIGAIISPLNWRLTIPELIYIANDSMPSVIFIGPEWVESYKELKKETNIEHVVALENAKIDNAFNYDDEVGRASPSEPERPADLNEDDVYCIMYTSGTTGRPKGAMLPHRQFLWNCINVISCWGLTEKDQTIVYLPLFHAGGLFAYLTPLLYVGGRVTLLRAFDADLTLKLIEQEKCTVILGVPTIYQMWYDAPYFKKADLSSLTYVNVGGAPIPKPLMEKWINEKNIYFRQGFGLTEVGPNCFAMTNEESRVKLGSFGKPIFHSQVKLIDKEGKEVPVGEVGEIVIKGPHVCLGYWNKPEDTKKTIIDGWFHTGDMARRDEDGFLYIAGRSKEMIISGGENIYSAEVEAVFNDHEAVESSALIGKPHEKWGEIGLLIVKLKPGYKVTEEELIEFCTKTLAKYKIPRELKFIDEMPFNTFGKIEKQKLKKMYNALENIA